MNVFLPGFIFIWIFSKIHNKQLDITYICLWSLFISQLITGSCSILHDIVLVSHTFTDQEKILCYAAIGLILPIITTYILKCKIFKWLFIKINNQTINSDILDDVIDYNKRTLMSVFLKEADYYYIGTFILKEENGMDSRIALIDYAQMDKKTNNVLFHPQLNSLNSLVVINLNDVERIELTYDKDSEVWKNLAQKNKNK